MYPTLQILNKSFPTYWLCAIAGAAACFLVAALRYKKFKELQTVDITNLAALILIGSVAGGRLLSVITMIPVVIKNRHLLFSDLALLYDVLSNGLVFYGGLFGALLTLNLYLKKYALNKSAFFDFFIPLFPLFHCFGRIGCLLTGCCHGIPSVRFGIAFTNSLSAPNGVPFFPVQIIGIVGNWLLFLFLLHFEKKHHLQGKTLNVYLLIYAVGRFFVEFLRGDEIRGFIGGLSTSQWISLGILLFYLIQSVTKAPKKVRKA